MFNENELKEPSTTEFFSVVKQDRNRKICRKTKFYNFDDIISAGYKVKSQGRPQFRIWLSSLLKYCLINKNLAA